MYLIIGKTGCGYCEKAKNLLEQKRIPYVYQLMGRDISFEAIRLRYPEAKTFPIIVDNDEYIGGFMQLENLLKIKEENSKDTSGNGQQFLTE